MNKIQACVILKEAWMGAVQCWDGSSTHQRPNSFYLTIPFIHHS